MTGHTDDWETGYNIPLHKSIDSSLRSIPSIIREIKTVDHPRVLACRFNVLMGHCNPEAIALPVRIAAERRILHRKPVFHWVLLQKGNGAWRGNEPNLQQYNWVVFSDYAIWLLTLLLKVKFNFCDEHDCPFHSGSPFKAHYDLELIDSWKSESGADWKKFSQIRSLQREV